MSPPRVQQALHKLGGRLPAGRLSCDDADRFAVSQDMWPRNILRMYHGRGPALPAAVVWPQDVAEIQQILAWANEEAVTVVPYGAGSGVVGGTTVHTDQVVLDLKRMQRVCDIDATARTCTAEAGILGELLERQLRRSGLSQGHFPSSIYCSTLGGWLATRSGGQASCRYGKIEDQVLGGVVVLGDGTAVTQRARPGLSPLFAGLTGNEGILGIWAQATLRVHPLPEAQAFLAFDFPDLDRALLAARAMLVVGLTPSILRIYDPLDTLLHRDTHGRPTHRDRGPSWSAALGAFLPSLISYVGDHLSQQCRCIIVTEGAQAMVEDDAQHIADIAQNYGGRSRGAAPARAWYEKRYAVSYRMSNVYRAGVAVDTMEVACAWEHVMAVYTAVKRAGLACGAQVMAHFSHLYLEGASIYFTYALPAASGEGTYDRLWETTLRAAAAHGANISHHHGIGQLKSAALGRAWGDYGAALNTLRKACDPQQVLNPATMAMHAAAHVHAQAVSPLLEVGSHARWTVAQPDESLAGVEARLAPQGQTLGAVAALFPDVQVLQGARASRLWRVNPQIRVIEPLIMGVDADLGQAHHTFVPAPRAAQGPDLQATLLAQKVTRLWLRTQKSAACTWHARLPKGSCIATVQHLVQAPLAERLRCEMIWRGDDWVDLLLIADHLHPNEAKFVASHLPTASQAPHAPAQPQARPADVVRFAATWAEARAHLEARFTAHTTAFAWTDSIGLLGFVDAQTHRLMASRDHLKQFFDDGVTRHPCAAQPIQNACTPPPEAEPASAPPTACTFSSQQPHRAALENCTFCPKMCRFACPVATATGSETTIPRQMMLATRLDVTRQRPLNASVARSLYSCVDCRGCRTFCDHDNDVATTLQQARAELWDTDWVPPTVRQVCDSLAAKGTMPQNGSSTVITPFPNSPGARTTLFFGCQNDSASTAAMRGAYALTEACHGATGVMHGSAQCCGHPLLRWGHRQAFIAHARRFAVSLPRKTRRFVVDDPGCAYTLVL